jgi:hypothetical protein
MAAQITLAKDFPDKPAGTVLTDDGKRYATVDAKLWISYEAVAANPDLYKPIATVGDSYYVANIDGTVSTIKIASTKEVAKNYFKQYELAAKAAARLLDVLNTSM